MLFGVHIAICALQAAEQERKWEQEYLIQLSPEQRKDYYKKKEQARQEAIAERRHREMCDAIRSTSFWRFGG